MKLARKLQLAYLSLMLIPMLTMGILVVVSYYSGPVPIGPHASIDSPGWIKSELSIILKKDWNKYQEIDEKIIIFIMDSEGLMVFPNFANGNFIPEDYPYVDSENSTGSTTPRPFLDQAQVYLPEVFERHGVNWTLDLTFSPVVVDDEKYLVGWRTPQSGIPGFMARRGWFIPLIVLIGIMLIPAFIDAKLRQSIRRLQESTTRLSQGDLDEPIQIHSRDDLKDLAQTLEDTRVELKESRDRKSRFMMAVSHDLRTPLTSIKGYVEALGDGMAENPEDFQRYISVLDEKTGLLESRIDELIDFVRSETRGRMKPDEPIDLTGLMNSLNTAFSKDCGFAGRRYRSDIDLDATVKLYGNFQVFYRAWENLFSNALRHSHEDDEIVFRAGIEVDDILYGEIEDSGEGVSPEFIPLLFEPFARADRGRNTQGLGLGLASVKAVIEGYGGSLTYQPRDGGGSIFRISLPFESENSRN